MPEYIPTPDLNNVTRLAEMAAQTRAQGVLSAVQGLLSGVDTVRQNAENKKTQQLNNPAITITPELVQKFPVLQSLAGKQVSLSTVLKSQSAQNPEDVADIHAKSASDLENAKNPSRKPTPTEARDLGLKLDTDYPQSVINARYANNLKQAQTDKAKSDALYLNYRIKNLGVETKGIKEKMSHLDQAHIGELKTIWSQIGKIQDNARNGSNSDGDKQSYDALSQKLSTDYGIDVTPYDTLATPQGATIMQRFGTLVNSFLPGNSSPTNKSHIAKPQPNNGASPQPTTGQVDGGNDPLGLK